eukprot:jgi/Mesvir1/19974/Mv13232-RA.1
MFRQSLRCGFRNTRNGADEKTCIKGRQLRLYGRYKSETFDPTGPVKTVATTENAHCGTTKSRNLGTYEQCAKKGQLRLWGLYTKEDVDRARKRAGVTRAATQEVPLPPARKKRTRKPRRTLAEEEASAALLMLQKAEERKRQVKEREERAKMRDTAKIFEAAPLDPPPRTKRVFDTSLKRDQFRFQIYESQVGVVRALRPLLIYHNGKKHYEALLPRDSRRTRADYGDHPLLDPKGVLINNLNIRIENHDPPNTGMYTPPLDPYSDAPFRLGRVPYLNDKITHVRASPTGSFFTAVTLAVAMTDPLDTLHLTDNHSKHDKRLSEEDKKLMGRLQGDAQSYNSIQSNDGFLPRLKTEQGMKSVIEDIKNGKITDEIITLAAFEEGREIVILTRVGGNEPHLVTRLWARLYPTNNIGFKRIYLYKGHGGIYEPLRYE